MSTWSWKHTCYENKRNGQIRQNVLIFEQTFPTSITEDIWELLMRNIQHRFKGLKQLPTPLPLPKEELL